MKNPVKVDDMFTPGRGGMMLFKCIECESEFAETWSHDLPEYKFCPICGVKFTEVHE